MNNDTTGKPVYTMRYRPVSSFTLPDGILTNWLRLPQIDGHTMSRAYPDLKTSTHAFGEFTTNRDLTEAEMEQFQVDRVDPEHLARKRCTELRRRITALQQERELFKKNPEDVTELTRSIENARASWTSWSRPRRPHSKSARSATWAPARHGGRTRSKLRRGVFRQNGLQHAGERNREQGGRR